MIKRATKEQQNSVLELYNNEIYNYQEVSNKVGMTIGAIKHHLAKNGFKQRSREKAATKYVINENYFEVINSEDKAYFLGLIYADGCLVSGRPQLKIGLQENDSHILQQFIEKLEYSGKLRLINCKGKGFSISNQIDLTISNKKVYNDLLNKGLYPNKSLTLQFPKEGIVPPHLIRHFIRGYFDGDGCINMKTSGQRRFILCGTYDFLNTISIILNKECNTNITKVRKQTKGNSYILNIGGNKQVERIYKYFYTESSIFLERKYKKFNENILQRKIYLI